MKTNYTTNKTLIFLLMLLISQSVYGQFKTNRDESLNRNYGNNMVSSQIDSFDTKHYWLAAGEVIGTNLTVWGYHKFLTKEEWANIDFNTIKHNFETGFQWDYDGFEINQFFHPYHGAAYYNSARSNGLSFWESVPYALLGSFTWEFFMENEAPSYNDIVNTPVSGIIIGEISYRVSNLVIDESTIGIERFGREFLGTLINPVQGVNRLFRGEMWRTLDKVKKHNVVTSISIGANHIFYGRSLDNNHLYSMFRLDIEYGNKLEAEKHDKPFDYFNLHAEENFTNGDNITGIFASGVLWDKKIDFLNSNQSVLGIYKELDILINLVYKLSATSVSGQFTRADKLSGKLNWQNNLGLSVILLGATNSEYSDIAGVNYNQGPGVSIKMSSQISLADIGNLYFTYRKYWIHTLNGVDGNEFIGLLNIGSNINLFSNTKLGIEYLTYSRFGNYDNYLNTFTSNSAVRVFVKFNI